MNEPSCRCPGCGECAAARAARVATSKRPRGILQRLYAVAGKWQGYHERDLDGIVEKIAEESDEYASAIDRVGKLDELGDVIINALRAVHRMSPAEREFVVKTMEMKARRRIDDPGVKDKAAESVLTAKFAAKLKASECNHRWRSVDRGQDRCTKCSKERFL